MNKLAKLEAKSGKPLAEIIPPMANSHGVVGAADQLKLSPSTISKWLKDNGYRPRTIWEQGS